MVRYLARRLAQAAVIVGFVAAISFALIHLAPGDPFSAVMDNPNVSESVRQTLRAQYGLDKPLPEQFVRYIGQLARGDLGWSFSHDRPVLEVLATALPNTVLLMGVALVGSFALGILIALIQVAKRGSATDHALSGVTLLLFSMPDFWLAILALLAVLPSDYIRTARLKGLSEREILRRHALRNALLPIISLIGLSFPALLTGAFFIEKIFAWPGMGLAVVNAIGTRDYPLVVGGVIIGGIMVTLGSLLADMLYAWADPRLRGR